MNLHTANNKFWETNNDFVAPEGGEGGGGSVTVDTSLSSTSTNPVQNKVIYAAIQDINTELTGVDTLIGSGVIE